MLLLLYGFNVCVPSKKKKNSYVETYCCCSVAKLCLTLCDPMDYGTPGFSILHGLLEFAQTHVYIET